MPDSRSHGPVRFPWTRFWYPRGRTVRESDDGYLLDPEGEHGRLISPDAVALADKDEIHFVGLLGEPGIGKTLTIQDHVGQLAGRLRGSRARLVVLGDHPDYEQLKGAVFEHSEFQAWRDGSEQLYLFLDGLDECMLDLPKVGAWLAGSFERLKPEARERLYLRIACRPAVWPLALEDRLARLWPDSHEVLTLGPLRERDVHVAAAQVGLDALTFTDAVKQRGLGPLASRPVTLAFLLGDFARGAMPASKSEAYASGCLRLSEERDPQRWDAGRVGDLEPGQRLAIARRIAAISLLANRPVLHRSGSTPTEQGEELGVGEVVGGVERDGSTDVVVSREPVREVLDTGLFQAAGPGRLRFAHRTYGEFLASRHMAERLDLDTIVALVCSPGARPKVIPQLAEVVAWLADAKEGLFDVVMERDPEVLLASDVATRQATDRARLAEALLRLQDQQPIRDIARARLVKLAHNGLGDLLRPWLTDRTKSEAVRQLAVDIAGATGAEGLTEALVDLALDGSESLSLRWRSLEGLQRTEPAMLVRLLPLAQGVLEDRDDQLKGEALRLLWPSALSTREALDLVTAPRNDDVLGSYFTFLRSFASNLDDADLPTALAWVAGAGERLSGWALTVFVDTILARASAKLDNEAMARAVAPALLVRLAGNERPYHSTGLEAALGEVTKQAGRRRILLRALAQVASGPGQNITQASYLVSRYGRTEDFPWICTLICDPSTPEPEREALAQVGRFLFFAMDPAHLDALWPALDCSPTLDDLLGWVRNASVRLNSQEAAEARQRHQQEQDWKQQLAARRQAEAFQRDRLNDALRRCSAGDADAWLLVAHELRRNEEGTEGPNAELDLTGAWAWGRLQDDERSATLAAAVQFLELRDPAPAIDPAGRRFSYATILALRALWLVQELAPTRLDGLPAERWAAWAPVLLGILIATSEEEHERKSTLLCQCYAATPEALEATLKAALEREARTGLVTVHSDLAPCWGRRLSALVHDWIKDRADTAVPVELMSFLIEHDPSDLGETLAVSMLDPNGISDAAARGRVVSAAVALLTSTPPSRHWAAIKEFMNASPRFGRRLMRAIAHRTSGFGVPQSLAELSEDDLGDLYRWLVQCYPPKRDRPMGRAGTVTPRYRMQWIRDGIPDVLAHRDSDQALSVLDTLAREFAHTSNLQFTLREAEHRYLTSTWQPLTPAHLLELLQDRQRRVVTDEPELLDLLTESLSRAQAELHGHTPAVTFLWDHPSDPDRREPRREVELSDWIKLFLERDLTARPIVVNREVEVRPGWVGVARGQRVDIHVDAVTQTNAIPSRLRVIIEVKGCWNNDLHDAMEIQLVDRYLQEAQGRAGVYLVVRFDCAQSGSRRRCRACRTQEEAELRQELEAQAEALSREDRFLRTIVLDASLRLIET